MSDNWHIHIWRVRYQECDQMGVVYHPNYLNWFEIGRTEWIRDKGWSYRRLEERGFRLPLLDANLHFRQPARYDDIVLICTRLAAADRLQVVFESEVRRAHAEVQPDLKQREQTTLLVQGKTKHVWLNADWKPVRMDRAYPELFQSLRTHLEM